jgi:hypothetical protein
MVTYSNLARFPLPTPGDPAVTNSWGTLINNAWPCVEQLAAGVGTVDLSGLSSYTLTTLNDAPDQSRPAMLNFTGTATNNCVVTIPSVARIGWATNNTAVSIILTAGGTTRLTLAASQTALYYCDGANVTAYSLSAPGILTATSGILLPNNVPIQAKDAGGTARNLTYVGTDNSTNVVNVGGAGHYWRVLNQAQNAALFIINDAGAATFASTLAVTGATTTAGVTSTAGLTSTGYDAGGLNTRYIAGSYGAGWRNDGTNLYLLLTNSGSSSGTYNTLRPFYVSLSSGHVSIDSGGVGTGFGGPVSTGALTASSVTATAGTIGSVTLSGGTCTAGALVASSTVTAYQANVSYVTVFGNITVNGTCSGAAGVFTNCTVNGGLGIGSNLTSPNATITNLNCTALASANYVSAAGTLYGATLSVTNASVAGTVTAAQLTSTGNANVSGTLYAYGSAGFAASGYGVTPPVVASVVATVGCSVIAGGAMGAGGFYTTSDVRQKADIKDIEAAEAIGWINRARPRTYTMDGVHQAGFIAQEEMDASRGAAVAIIPDDRPQFAEGDGYAPAGARLTRRYDHDVAYITRALQNALIRIDHLERQIRERG